MYLSYRTRSGEVLTPNSPFIREQFDGNDTFRVHNPKHVNKSTLGEIIAVKLRQAGIRDITHVTELVHNIQILLKKLIILKTLSMIGNIP